MVLLLFLQSPRVVLAAPPAPDLPLSHPVYDLLDRFEARGLMPTTISGIRPYDRNAIAGMLDSARSRNGLTRVESEYLDRYRREFRSGQDPVRSGSNWLARTFDGDFFSFSDSVVALTFNPIFRQNVLAIRGDARPDETVSQTFVGASVQGIAFGRIVFRAQHFEAREWSSRLRLSRADVLASPLESVQLKQKTADFREARFQLKLASRWLSFDVGKESFDWGPGRDANLLLHGAAPSYVYARLRAQYRAVEFQHFLGVLRPRPGTRDSTRIFIDNGHLQLFQEAKRLAAHRLEVRLGRNLRVGLQEAVVFGRRGFEAVYAIPVSPLVAAQTFAGDTDNLVVGLDASYRVAGRGKVYGALFFDDLKKFSPGAFANQVGLQIGALVVDPSDCPTPT